MLEHLPATVDGDGPPLLLLHGGPGMDDYLTPGLAEETVGWQRVGYTQRGTSPSTTEGPFTVAQHVADAVAVLDDLEIDQAAVLGHSWGGFLAAALALAHPGRVRGLLLVDPMGIVGDGGMAAFGRQLEARTPEPAWRRATELDERVSAGTASAAETTELLALLWPAYFDDPETAPPMPPIRLSGYASAQTYADATALLESGTLAAGAATYEAPVEVVHGLGSPIPPEAAIDTAHAFPRGSATGLAGVGHFVWLEQPGCVADALVRLGLRL